MYLKMRIKKVAFIGTLILISICLCLYLTLDRTLTRHYKLGSNVVGALVKVSEEPVQLEVRLLEESAQISKSNYDIINSVCPVIHKNPVVDIQMSEVYDRLPFDNPDGGVWKQGWNVTYKDNQWNRDNILKIILVPHSHNDPGWKKTFEEYYQSQTRSILNNMVKKLMEDSRRKFIWAEISFFSLWWSEINNEIKENVKKLLAQGQLEFVTGGWVMNDEANSHYYSIFQQLFHGHQWLSKNLNYTPKYSWSIDPFGLTPTMPYILKKMDFTAVAVQRSHYAVKKYLSKNKQLEFTWSQLWDGGSDTGLLTHMMPFYSYDVPHTCGPDPKICCQFDFKRLPGYGVSCPWRVPPQRITPHNVASRVGLILDQYRKKAQLYRSNVVLVPLGDDFRYDTSSEWDAQYTNYRLLFDYINSNPQLHAKAEFGTLSDYFKALVEETGSDFPRLTGDFFTYADRDDHYWSGYYTSRPYHKRLDRVLNSKLRGAEIALTLLSRLNKTCSLIKPLTDKLSVARSSLALFQHHDGITGTAKDHVVVDYYNKLIEAIRLSHHVLQQSAYLLLSQTKCEENGEGVYFTVDNHDKMWGAGGGDSEAIVRFTNSLSVRRVTIFNSLTSTKNQVITLRVDTPLLKVVEPGGETIVHQLSPFCNVSLISTQDQCYLLSFAVSIPPLSFSTYSILPSEDDSGALATMKLINWLAQSSKALNWPIEQVLKEQGSREFSLESDRLSAAFSKQGLLKAVTLKLPDTAITIPVHLSFVRYGARRTAERSGAYLFLPEGDAETISIANPRIAVIQGSLFSRVIVRLPNLIHTVTLYNSNGSEGYGIEIQNVIDISPIHDNFEMAMRFSTNIKNGQIFFTDLNGLQIIKRKRLNRIPLQGNYYPMPAAAYIEDAVARFTLLTAQPLGVASLSDGQLEVMQDRRLLQDDNRGLDQGVLDNRQTLNIFRIHVETFTHPCKQKSPPSDDVSTWGKLSPTALSSLESLTYPVEKLLSAGDITLPSVWGPASSGHPSTFRPAPPHLHLVTALALPSRGMSTALVLQTSPVELCLNRGNFTHYNSVSLSALLPIKKTEKVFKSSLNFINIGAEIKTRTLTICDIDIASFLVENF